MVISYFLKAVNRLWSLAFGPNNILNLWILTVLPQENTVVQFTYHTVIIGQNGKLQKEVTLNVPLWLFLWILRGFTCCFIIFAEQDYVDRTDDVDKTGETPTNSFEDVGESVLEQSDLRGKRVLRSDTKSMSSLASR